MREILSSLNPIAKASESASLCMRFIQSETYKNARAIFGFMPLKDEVDILPILRAALAAKKKVLLPKIAGKTKMHCKTETDRYDEKDSAIEIDRSGDRMDFYFVERDPIEETEKSVHGIFEPKPSCEKADIKKLCEEFCGEEIVVLVPGLAFAKNGFRLGRGGGYYDEFLKKLPELCLMKENAENSERRAKLVGVCYGAQIVESVPHEEWDARVDLVMGI